jgi:hypothetical protein
VAAAAAAAAAAVVVEEEEEEEDMCSASPIFTSIFADVYVKICFANGIVSSNRFLPRFPIVCVDAQIDFFFPRRRNDAEMPRRAFGLARPSLELKP